MRTIRVVIPHQTAAKVHAAAINNQCSVPEAAGCLLWSTVERMTVEEASQWVEKTLPNHRALIQHEQAATVKKGGL